MSDFLDYGKQILAVLSDHGYQAYFVGGYVRDFLLGIPTGDIDITTDATPDIVRSLFDKTKNTGERFGTVTVFLGNYGY
jgi:tRNA nucleotidyltransferase (CCA-adding enzyme)